LIKSLGLDLKALGQMGALERLEKIRVAVAGISDSTQRAQVMGQLLGRGSLFMGGFIGDPNAIKNATAALGDIPTIMANNAKAFDRLGDTFDTIKIKAQGIWLGLAEGLLPILDRVTDLVAKLDLVGIGQRIGRFVSGIVEALRQHTLDNILISMWTTAIGTMKVMWLDFLDFLASSFARTITEALVDTLLSTSLAGTIFKDLFPKTAKKLTGWAGGVAQESLAPGMAARQQQREDIYWTTLRAQLERDAMLDEVGMGVERDIKRSQIGDLGVGVPAAAAPGAQIESFVSKFAPLALKGSAEAYKAEYGISDSSKKTAENTAKMATDISQIKEGVGDLNSNLDFEPAPI
jgi:hypothetical protein